MSKRSGAKIFVALLLYAAFKLLLPMLPIKPTVITIYVSMLLLTAAAFALASAIATAHCSWKLSGAAAALCFSVWMLGYWLGELKSGGHLAEFSSVVQEVGMLCFASFAGKGASLIIREGNLILPAAIAMVVVDVWCVNLSKTTPQVVERADKLFKAMTVKLPPAGVRRMPVPTLLMGFGDVFFAALIIAALHRFGFEVRVSLWLAVLATALGLTLVSLLDIPLAGLPFVVCGLLLPSIRKLRLTRHEWIATAVGIGALIIILLAVWLVLNR